MTFIISIPHGWPPIVRREVNHDESLAQPNVNKWEGEHQVTFYSLIELNHTLSMVIYHLLIIRLYRLLSNRLLSQIDRSFKINKNHYIKVNI